MDVKDKTKGVEEVKKNKVRITLTCRNLKSVENGKYPTPVPPFHPHP